MATPSPQLALFFALLQRTCEVEVAIGYELSW
jgi:hypothetical protein